MDRRSFLVGMFAACASPAIVRADSLMRVVARNTTIIAPELQQFVVTSVTGGNVLISPALMADEALRALRKNMRFMRQINDDFSAQFRLGDIITIDGVGKINQVLTPQNSERKFLATGKLLAQ